MATIESDLGLRSSTGRSGFWAGLVKQADVVGALLMRELHTRYGRDNIGYLWLIGEPMMLASVIGLLHSGAKSGGEHIAGVTPIAFTVVGYTVFIMFRGIVNRAEGTLEVNQPLLYHHIVSVFDLTFARSLLEAAGTVITYLIMVSLLIAIGMASMPVRPLYIAAAIAYVLWISFAHALIITSFTYENKTLERLVHPYTYFMIPLSGSFFQVKWLPHPYREYLTWNPLPSAFEMLRYGQFEGMTLDYVYPFYMIKFAMVMTLLGLYGCSTVRDRVVLH